MVNFDFDKILPVIASLVGISLGWLLNELSSWFKVRREDKRLLKDVLFNLLDIRFIISLSDLDTFTEKTISILKNKFPGQLPADINIILNQVFNIFLQSIIAEKQMKELKSIEMRYKSSIENISKVDPFLAYFLSGKQTIYNYIEYLNEYTYKIDEISKSQISQSSKNLEPPDLNEFKTKVKSILHPQLYRQALEVITEDVKKVSKKLGRINSYKASQIIIKQNNKDIHTDLEVLIDGLLKSMFTV